MLAALKEVSESKALEGRHICEYREIIFRVYNRKVAEHAQLFLVFHSFETAFRSTVSVELETYYGQQQWWAAIYKALRKGHAATTVECIGGRKLPRDTAHLIGEILEYIDGDSLHRNIVPRITTGYLLVEQCKLSQIGKLITQHWLVFKSKFHHAHGQNLTCHDFR